MTGSYAKMLIPFYLILLTVGVLSKATEDTQNKPKRQIFREQVLPSSGGKIPDGAFRTDRLALNKLNKAGISVPDGVLLEHRHVYSHPHSIQHDPEDEADLVQIVQKPSDRYAPPEGTYHNKRPLTVSSTYIIRKPTDMTNIRTPNYQKTHPHYLPSKQIVFGGFHTLHTPPPTWRPFVFEEEIRPPPYLYHERPPPVYPSPQPKKPSVAYYPITVPLQLPNTKPLKESYYHSSRQHDEAENIHDIVNWPYLLGEYTRLEDEINAINHGPYSQNTQHSLFTPEVVAQFESHFYGAQGRYARKSKEIPFTDQRTSSLRRVSSKDARTVIKLRCTLSRDNTVDGRDTKCRLRF